MDSMLTEADNDGNSGQNLASALHARSHMHPSRPLKYLRLTGPLPVDHAVSALVHVRVYRAGDWSVVQIDGELDIQGVLAVPPLLTGEGALVVFDLHRTTFMDCSGLRLLANTARTASQRGGCVRVAGASPQVRKIVMLTNLDRAVSMFESLADALTAPTGSGSARPARGIVPARGSATSLGSGALPLGKRLPTTGAGARAHHGGPGTR